MSNDDMLEVKKPKMWRKRYVPNEIVDISNDDLIFRDENILITKWLTIKPKNEFQKGVSFYLLNKGIKISKLLKDNGDFVKYYCDIIDTEYNKLKDEYIFTDLLLDLQITPGCEPEILDMDELIEAEDTGIITTEVAELSKKRLQNLLEMIKENNFPPIEIKKFWDKY